MRQSKMPEKTTQRLVPPLRGDLMTPDEVAEKLRMSVKSVYAMAANNEITPHKIRCSLRFDSADVDDYIFFSKYNTGIGNLRLSSITAHDIAERVYSEVDHAMNYINKFVPQAKEAAMKK
jgi:excisionase family DNA binding protein